MRPRVGSEEGPPGPGGRDSLSVFSGNVRRSPGCHWPLAPASRVLFSRGLLAALPLPPAESPAFFPQRTSPPQGESWGGVGVEKAPAYLLLSSLRQGWPLPLAGPLRPYLCLKGGDRAVPRLPCAQARGRGCITAPGHGGGSFTQLPA